MSPLSSLRQSNFHSFTRQACPHADISSPYHFVNARSFTGHIMCDRQACPAGLQTLDALLQATRRSERSVDMCILFMRD